jgi:hypothetical protein
MRVALVYGVVTGGGCERRMGDICRWLLDHGDECWIIASTFDGLGEAVLHGQCGVPVDRVIYLQGSNFEKYNGNFENFVYDQLATLSIDVADIQWHIQIPPQFPCTAIATVHGAVPAPPVTAFQGVISVEENLGLKIWYDHMHPRVMLRCIQNWVNLKRYPYQEKLGNGICFVGRSFKMLNIQKIAPFYDGVIEAYGTSHSAIEGLPSNVNWHGFVDPATVIYRHRILFGSAQVALEGLAAGRLVIAGQRLHLSPDAMPNVQPDGRLVTIENVDSMIADGMQFSYTDKGEPSAEQVWFDVQRALRDDMTKQRRALRKRVERLHNIDTQIGLIRQFYEELA